MANDKLSFPSDAADKFVVRFPGGMRDNIATAAKDNNRTMNAEIIARLQASFAPAAAQDMFSTPDFQHRLKERALQERIQLANGQISTLKMHRTVLHMRIEALGKGEAQEGLFDAREQLADAEQNLAMLMQQRDALLIESQVLDRVYQDAVRPLNVKATELTEELLEPERRATEEKLRKSSERLGKLNPTQSEIQIAALNETENTMRMYRATLFESVVTGRADEKSPTKTIQVTVRGKKQTISVPELDPETVAGLALRDQPPKQTPAKRLRAVSKSSKKRL